MISLPDERISNVSLLHAAHLAARPFPHTVIDGFVDAAALRQVVQDVESVPRSRWIDRERHGAQVNKTWIQDPTVLPSAARSLLLKMNAPETLEMMSTLTGIPGLLPDPGYLGGGVHSVGPGGRLEIHADFNFHPGLKLHRRVNALLYLNENWSPEWGGNLELWEPDMSRCAKSIEPLFNRLVVFNITDRALHGHPLPLACPPHRRRLSLALYYYTLNRPVAECSPFHWADWKTRPNP